MKDINKLKDLVLEKVDLADLMLRYDVEFVYNPRAAEEVQYKCPFHGADNKPSARFYRATKSSWCWVCRKKWDAISFMRDRETLTYVGAILRLIDIYKIDTSVIPDAPDFNTPRPKKISNIGVAIIRLKEQIRDLKGKISLEKYRALCTAWYMISFDYINKKEVTDSIIKLESKMGVL